MKLVKITPHYDDSFAELYMPWPKSTAEVTCEVEVLVEKLIEEFDYDDVPRTITIEFTSMPARQILETVDMGDGNRLRDAVEAALKEEGGAEGEEASV